MPLPKTRKVGKIIRYLKKENKKRPTSKKWAKDQKLAIALTHARKMGAKISPPKNEDFTMENNIQETTGLLTKAGKWLGKTKLFQKTVGSKAARKTYKRYLKTGGLKKSIAAGRTGLKSAAKSLSRKAGKKAAERAGIKTVKTGAKIAGTSAAVGAGVLAARNIKKRKQEDVNVTANVTELRNFINDYVELNNMETLREGLRNKVAETTISANVHIGPPAHPIPGGKKDFKKDKNPGERDKSDHGVKDDEVEDIEDTPDSERTGHTGVQAGNAKKKPVGEAEDLSMKRTGIEKKDGGKIYKDKQKPDDVDPIEVDDTDDTSDNERTGHSGMKATSGSETTEDIREYIYSLSEEEFEKFMDGLDEEEAAELEGILNEDDEDSTTKLLETIDAMTEEEFEAFTSELDEEEIESLDQLLGEMEEVLPDEIDASNPPEVGSEDEKDGMRSVDKDLDTPQKKKHTATKVEIMPEDHIEEKEGFKKRFKKNLSISLKHGPFKAGRIIAKQSK